MPAISEIAFAPFAKKAVIWENTAPDLVVYSPISWFTSIQNLLKIQELTSVLWEVLARRFR
jgi:2-phospho-L-lactate transferase/gluconeogenesis factor (CofD/UPF0052 family)